MRVVKPDLVIPPLILGRDSEWLTKDQTLGQFYFTYKGQDKIELKGRANPRNRIFLSVPGYRRWVYGEDYGYSPKENSIYFLREPPRIYGIGGVAGPELGRGTIVWVFYHPAEEERKN